MADTDAQAPVPVDVRGLPKWLQAAIYLGVPSLLAIWLVYVMTTQIQARIVEIEKVQQTTAQALKQALDIQQQRVQDTNQAREQLRDGLERIEDAIQRLCVISATGLDARAACLTEGRLDPRR